MGRRLLASDHAVDLPIWHAQQTQARLSRTQRFCSHVSRPVQPTDETVGLLSGGDEVAHRTVDLGAVECRNHLIALDPRACDSNAKLVDASRRPRSDRSNTGLVVVDPAEQAELGPRGCSLDDNRLNRGKSLSPRRELHKLAPRTCMFAFVPIVGACRRNEIHSADGALA